MSKMKALLPIKRYGQCKGFCRQTNRHTDKQMDQKLYAPNLLRYRQTPLGQTPLGKKPHGQNPLGQNPHTLN